MASGNTCGHVALNPGSAACGLTLGKCPYQSTPHSLLLKIGSDTDKVTGHSKIKESSANILNTIGMKISRKHLQSEFEST